MTFKAGDRVKIADDYDLSVGLIPYEGFLGKNATLVSTYDGFPLENGRVWHLKIDGEDTNMEYHDQCSEHYLTLLPESRRKITVWPLELTLDQAKSLIVWLMTDHDIVLVERDTPDGDRFVMDSETLN